MKPITEDKIETFAIEVLQSIGWEYVHGLAIAPGAEQAERENFEQIILIDRLRKAVAILNPDNRHVEQKYANQSTPYKTSRSEHGKYADHESLFAPQWYRRQ